MPTPASKTPKRGAAKKSNSSTNGKQMLISRFFAAKQGGKSTKEAIRGKGEAKSNSKNVKSAIGTKSHEGVILKTQESGGVEPSDKTELELNQEQKKQNSNTEPDIEEDEPQNNITLTSERDASLDLSSTQGTTQPQEEDQTTPKRSRRRLRRYEDYSDSDEGEERPTKRSKKQEDPDFDMSGKEESDDEDVALDNELIDEEKLSEEDDESDAEMNEVEVSKRGRDKSSEESAVTLASYSRKHREMQGNISRDPKRRKRFTEKMGKLEKDHYFMRNGNRNNLDEAVNRSSKGRKVVKYTPLESQIVKLRAQHPDVLLLVECGYKYRLFDRDAAVATQVLRLASYFDHNFLTASFPVHRLSYYVQRLVHAGKKVGVVRQTETAALKKAGDKPSKLFERKVTNVHTMGTLVADGEMSALSTEAGNMSNSASATYIMAILESELGNSSRPEEPGMVQISIAAVNSATGEVIFDSFQDGLLRENLESRIVSLEPVEILMTQDKSSSKTEIVVNSYLSTASARLERLPVLKFAESSAISNINSVVRAAYSETDWAPTAVICSLGALSRYLEEFGLQVSMSNATEYKAFRTKNQMSLGADVLRNFEVFGNSNDGSLAGSLLSLLNCTKTPFGNRQMRQWLANPLIDSQAISDRLDAVEFLKETLSSKNSQGSNSSDLTCGLLDLIKCLPKLPDLEKGLTRISCQKCKPSEFLQVIRSIELVGEKIETVKSLSLKATFPAMLDKLLSSAPDVGKLLNCDLLGALNRNAASQNDRHSLFKEGILVQDEAGGISEQFVDLLGSLSNANTEVEFAEKVMTKLLSKLKRKYSFASWQWKKVGTDEYLLEVPKARSKEIPNSWPLMSQTKSVKRFRPPEAAEGYDAIMCARETRDAVASKCWLVYLELFSKIATLLRSVVRAISTFDCLGALATVADRPGYVRPIIECDPKMPAGIHAVQARHPLFETLKTGHDYVPNDVKLGKGEHEIAMVISGPNYGGKSSYTRMTALLVILSQVGSFVPAKQMKLSPFDCIYARMGSKDSLAKGLSSLMVELSETSRILANVGPRALVVLDELGRGTSTHDGTAIAYATLSHLVRETRCVTLCITHFPLLAGLQKEYPSDVGTHYMDYIEERAAPSASDEEDPSTSTPKITFLYKLTRGIADSSYGLNVARLAGIPASVISMASGRACKFKHELERQRTKRRFIRHVLESAQTQGE